MIKESWFPHTSAKSPSLYITHSLNNLQLQIAMKNSNSNCKHKTQLLQERNLQADELEIMNPSPLQRIGSMNPLLLTAVYVLFLRPNCSLFMLKWNPFDRQMTGILCTRRTAVCNIIKNPGKTKDIKNSC